MGVPPDSFGVMRSKTHGMDQKLIKSGEFRWVWYKLIPTNVKTAVFRLNPVHYTFSAKNTLPSGTIYAVFAGIPQQSFSWEINAHISFALQPEALIPLVAAHTIDSQEALAFYEQDIAEQIAAFILRGMNSGAEFAEYTEALLKNGESPELEQQIAKEFPLITQLSLRVSSATVPDFALYRQTRALYEVYIAFQKEQVSISMQEKVKERIALYQRFDELERYGQLLTKFPVLLDYLLIENGKDK